MLRRDAFEQDMFARRMPISLFGEPTWIATPEDVVLHKLYWNAQSPSDRQLGDAAGVVAVQGNAIDVDRLRKCGKALGVSDALEDILAGRIRPKST